jgi:hypothetical protein
MRALGVVTAGLLVAGCGVREPGLGVTVRAVVSPLGGPALGLATLGLEQLELAPCPVARPWWHALSPLSTAWAHGAHDPGSNPRLATAPVLVDLKSAAPQVLGELAPPPGAVCGLTLTFAPSTAEASSQGTTLLLEGPGFRQLSTRRQVVSRTFDARALDEAHRTLELEVRLTAGVPAGDGDATLGQVLATTQVQ